MKFNVSGQGLNPRGGVEMDSPYNAERGKLGAVAAFCKRRGVMLETGGRSFGGDGLVGDGLVGDGLVGDGCWAHGDA